MSGALGNRQSNQHRSPHQEVRLGVMGDPPGSSAALDQAKVSVPGRVHCPVGGHSCTRATRTKYQVLSGSDPRPRPSASSRPRFQLPARLVAPFPDVNI